MAKFNYRGRQSGTNQPCRNQETTPIELHVGSECERDISGNILPTEGDGYAEDGYRQFKFIAEGSEPLPAPEKPKFVSTDKCGYHRFTVGDVFRGSNENGSCSTPYSRGVTGGADGGGFNNVIKDREEQLLNTTGKPVTLFRRQWTGPSCPCNSTTRGRARKKCKICFGTAFVPGFIPYNNQADPLGRIKVRFEPYTEDTPLKETGIQQQVTLNAWTLNIPIVQKRDILVAYNPDGSEEFRYEVITVTRNNLFLDGTEGAQKFQLQRLDPNDPRYLLDPYKMPDLADIAIDVSAYTPVVDRPWEQLGTEDDGDYPNIIIESIYGDAAFSAMFTAAYKEAYELNFGLIMNFQYPVLSPPQDGYGPVFRDTSGKVIKFSTPQVTQDNIGINPLEVLAAEKKKNYSSGWHSGAKHGVLDAENELRARGLT